MEREQCGMGFGLPLRVAHIESPTLAWSSSRVLKRKLFVCDIADQRMLELDPSVGTQVEEDPDRRNALSLASAGIAGEPNRCDRHRTRFRGRRPAAAGRGLFEGSRSMRAEMRPSTERGNVSTFPPCRSALSSSIRKRGLPSAALPSSPSARQQRPVCRGSSDQVSACCRDSGCSSITVRHNRVRGRQIPGHLGGE